MQPCSLTGHTPLVSQGPMLPVLELVLLRMLLVPAGLLLVDTDPAVGKSGFCALEC